MAQPDFRKTHNLTELGRMCAEIDSTLERVLMPAARLTDYAWKYRYPGEPAEPSRKELESALRLARGVYDAVTRLPPEVHPPPRSVGE